MVRSSYRLALSKIYALLEGNLKSGIIYYIRENKNKKTTLLQKWRL